MFSATKLLMSGGGNPDLGYWITYINDSGKAEYGATVDSSGNSYLLTYSGTTGQVVQFDVDGVLTDQYGLTTTRFTDCYHNGSELRVCGYDTGSASTAHFSRWGSGTLTEDEDLSVSGTAFSAWSIRPYGAVNMYAGVCTISSVTYSVMWVSASGNDGSSIVGRKLTAASSGEEVCFSVVTDNSSVYLASDIPNGTYRASNLVKYNSSGTLQWQRELNDSGARVLALGLAIDSSGNVYIAGEFGFTSLFIAKYDSSGTIQWQRTLAAAGDVNDFYSYGARTNCLTIDSSDNVYITCACSVTSDSMEAAYIAKYNSSGTLQWQRYFGVPSGSNWGQGSKWFDNALFLWGGIVISATTYSFMARLPDDGTLTGTHGSVKYAAADATDAAGSLTDAAGDMTSSTQSVTTGSDASTQSDPSYTDTKILVN